ncbi:adenylate/guanylate cyclase domain-containing protein [Roseobacter ponti]|uniref:Adenylate/guanylate cyclase domain-containing response regulator n=1 Tax=Roseobacter ponti TaxID=1891787 RepID=A0A858SYG6_9RHOB|nr:adenylate/guanylate cyclase domain-containing protein [Roseobacter ponti]QJF51906.1 adenylate/guanylate cyclase domain-containing response regulator [Roseobacter ponti]
MADAGGHLLIVDDNKVNRLLLSRSVELLGHRASVAENGRIAMERLQEESFDLVLLDIEMPEMDGFEVLAAIKDDPRLRDLPVIVTSSVEGIENIVRCIELGAEDYLAKPVNKTLLGARLSSGLEKKRLRDEQKRLLKRFATSEVADDLQASGFAIGGSRVRASVLFCDIRGFTSLSEDQSPEETIELLNVYYTLMFEAIGSHGGIVTLMIGDGLMAVFGAPQPLENPAASAVSAAQDMLAMMGQFNEERSADGRPAIGLGVGIATGEVVAGYAGTDQRATYTCIGSTVNLAARLEAHTKVLSREILIDAETLAALGGGFHTEEHTGVTLKGFAGSLTVCSVT